MGKPRGLAPPRPSRSLPKVFLHASVLKTCRRHRFYPPHGLLAPVSDQVRPLRLPWKHLTLYLPRLRASTRFDPIDGRCDDTLRNSELVVIARHRGYRRLIEDTE
jgi:hypothetical protein